ncbi:inositol 2-dehydrogenase [soil metagenome]
MTKVGILGLGRIGKIHLENLSTRFPGVEVLAAMNPSEAGQDYARKFRVPMVTSDADEVINHPEIEAIFVCSPTDSHADYVIKAARAGKAIFCEKPVDLSVEKVIQTLQVVKNSNVPLMLAFNQRFDYNFLHIKEQLSKEKIGKLYTLHLISRDPAPPPVDYIRKSGGLFLDMTIHDFDMARYLIGGEVREVFAKGYNLIDPEIGEAGDIDTGIIILNFENNATAIIENSRKAVYGYDQRLEVFGSAGMIRVENPLKNTNIYYNEDGAHQARLLDFFMDRYQLSYQREVEAFLHALQNNLPMPATGEDGLKAMLIAVAANRSLGENRPLRIEEVEKEV